MQPKDFDEMFWYSDPESMGRVILEKYNLHDFYPSDLSQTLYKRVFCTQKATRIPEFYLKKSQQLKHSF
ncbi:MAG: hypothetical protein WBA77_21595 [Microcoleaceae cyanobacterium]